MSNITFNTVTNLDGTEIEWAIIDRGDEGVTAMLKSEYDSLLEGHGNTVSNA